MDADVWRQAKGVLAEALLIPPNERDALVALLIGGVPGAGADLGELIHTFNRITDAHMARMAALGLSA